MKPAPRPSSVPSELERIVGARHPAGQIVLVLQGGGALGAYQAGVYQALAESHLNPDWVAGISIGAINAAVIAGNTPEARIEKLRQFWELVTAAPLWPNSRPLVAARTNPVGPFVDQAIAMAASFGSVGLSLVSGKPLDGHAEELRAVWQDIATVSGWTRLFDPTFFAAGGDFARGFANQMNAGVALTRGAPGFFVPRLPIP